MPHSASKTLALYLASRAVAEGAYGERNPERLRPYADYVGWERIAPDGSWAGPVPS